jgi:hypothetical protein
MVQYIPEFRRVDPIPAPPYLLGEYFRSVGQLGPLGAALCCLPVGWVLSGGFGLHLGKCINDMTIAWKVARMPRDVQCEDLEDGARFWSTRETASSPWFRDASGSD